MDDDELLRKVLAQLRDHQQQPDPQTARLKAAAAAGLPAELAKRLRGDTAEELANDAHWLAAQLPTREPDPDPEDFHREVLAAAQAKHRSLEESLHPYPAEKESQ